MSWLKLHALTDRYDMCLLILLSSRPSQENWVTTRIDYRFKHYSVMYGCHDCDE